MSSKVDSLLKKAAAFERLAVYGDRKAFLQALAQNLPRVLVPGPGGGSQWVDPNVPPPARPAPPAPPAARPVAPPAPLNPPRLPRVVVPAEGGGGQWADPNTAPVVNQTAVPPSSDESPIPFQHLMNAPATKEQQFPSSGGIGALQDFLNNTVFRQEIAAGQMAKLDKDNTLGPKTLKRLNQWAEKTGVGPDIVKEVIDSAISIK